MNVVIDYASLDNDGKEVNAVAISYKIDGAEKRCWLEKVRRLGYWTYHYNGFNYIGICSICGKQTAFVETNDGAPHGYPHCPHCGAKMDKKTYEGGVIQ